MKIKCRFRAISILFLIVLLIFTGCKGDDVPQTDNDNIKRDDLEHATLTFDLLYYSATGNKGQREDVLQEIEDKCNLNITLDIRWVDLRDYSNEMKRALGGESQEVDAVYCFSPGPGFFDYTDAARTGKLADITELFPQYAPDLYAQLSAEQIEVVKIDGKMYIIPNNYPVQNITHVVVREDLLNKYEIDAIKTLEDYEEFMSLVKEYETSIVPGAYAGFTRYIFAGIYGYGVIHPLESGFVYKNESKELKLIPWEQTPEFKNIAGLITKWHKNKYLTYTNDMNFCLVYGKAKLMSGELASMLMGYNINAYDVASEVNSSNTYTENNWKLKAFQLYPENDAERISPVAELFNNGAIGILETSPDKERVLMFLNWIHSKQENYDFFMYGIEGIDYKKVGDERYSLPYKTESDIGYYFTWESRDAFKNINYDRLPSNYPEGAKESIIENLHKNTRYSRTAGFYPVFLGMESKIRSRGSSVFLNLELPLYKGGISSDELDSIIQDIAKGTDDIVTHLQRQLDDWLTSSN